MNRQQQPDAKGPGIKRLQITVADENGTVVDTGWVAVPGVNRNGLELAGSTLFNQALELGLENGVYLTPEEAEAMGDTNVRVLFGDAAPPPPGVNALLAPSTSAHIYSEAAGVVADDETA